MTDKPPAVDQDGKLINPHNPEFITKVPWYLGNHGPTLKHHNIQKNDKLLSLQETDELIAKKISAQRELQATAPKIVYKKGACKNCGATTHKEKDCLERPRSTKKSAWKTGLDIASDDVVVNLESHGKLSYDAKRDSWTGYDAKEYQDIMARHERLEEERRKEKAKEIENKKLLLEERKKQKLEQRKARHQKRLERIKAKAEGLVLPEGDDPNISDSSDTESESEEEIDEDALHEEFKARDDEARDFQDTMVPQGGLGGAGMRQTVRNLRIREDTPKYLRNLDLNSAFYDPKSRSMRANPFPEANPEDLPFAGDNFVRYSGDAVKLAQNQILCWEMQQRGEDVDVVTNPSQAEFLHRVVAEKKQTAQEMKRKEILDKYLDGKEVKTLDPRLRLGQTEAYVEYSKDGRVIKGAVMAPPVARTKYEEDVMINNHTAVWGSYFNRLTQQWGFACCHSLLKNSYCTGEKGKAANDAAQTAQSLDSFQLQRMLEKDQGPAAGNGAPAANSTRAAKTNRSDLYGEASTGALKNLDESKLREALKRQEDTVEDGRGGAADSKKRSYNSMKSSEMTAEDMEAYRMRKVKADDPMANYVDKDDF